MGYPAAESLPKKVVILQLWVVYEILFISCMFTIQFSIGCLFIRHSTSLSIGLGAISLLFFTLFATFDDVMNSTMICFPFAKANDQAVKWVCNNRVALSFDLGSRDVLKGIYFLLLPLLGVTKPWRMRMPTKQNFGTIVAVTASLM